MPDLRFLLRHVHSELDELSGGSARPGIARQRHDSGRIPETPKEFVKQSARQLMKLIEKDIKPRDIVTKEAIDNAFALDMAMGGSTNTVLAYAGDRARSGHRLPD